MNTQRNSIGKMAGMLLLFLVASLFMSTGCQKDDLMTNGSISTVYSNGTDRLVNPGDIVSNRLIPILTIRHESARTAAKDYVFNVYANGTASFIGVRNVAFVGEKRWDVTGATYKEFVSLMQYSNFFNIVDNNQQTPDLPQTITTYTEYINEPIEISNPGNPASKPNLSRTKSLVDFNNGTPIELFRLRTTIEKIFKISDLVGPTPGPIIISSTSPLD